MLIRPKTFGLRVILKAPGCSNKLAGVIVIERLFFSSLKAIGKQISLPAFPFMLSQLLRFFFFLRAEFPQLLCLFHFDLRTAIQDKSAFSFSNLHVLQQSQHSRESGKRSQGKVSRGPI